MKDLEQQRTCTCSVPAPVLLRRQQKSNVSSSGCFVRIGRFFCSNRSDHRLDDVARDGPHYISGVILCRLRHCYALFPSFWCLGVTDALLFLVASDYGGSISTPRSGTSPVFRSRESERIRRDSRWRRHSSIKVSRIIRRLSQT